MTTKASLSPEALKKGLALRRHLLEKQISRCVGATAPPPGQQLSCFARLSDTIWLRTSSGVPKAPGS